jgi:Tfp pilus assembly protein PilV
VKTSTLYGGIVVILVLIVGGGVLAISRHQDQVNTDNARMQADAKMKSDEAAMKLKATPTPTAMMHEASPSISPSPSATPDAMKHGN